MPMKTSPQGVNRWYMLVVALVLIMPGVAPWLTRVIRRQPEDENFGQLTRAQALEKTRRIGSGLAPQTPLRFSAESQILGNIGGGVRHRWMVQGNVDDPGREAGYKTLLTLWWNADTGVPEMVMMSSKTSPAARTVPLTRAQALAAADKWHAVIWGPRPSTSRRSVRFYSMGKYTADCVLKSEPDGEQVRIAVNKYTGRLNAAWRKTTPEAAR